MSLDIGPLFYWCVMVEYPKALYRGGVIVEGQEQDFLTVHGKAQEEAANADGWWMYGAAPVESDVLSGLRTLAESKGVKVDKRWKEDRLRAEIEKVA